MSCSRLTLIFRKGSCCAGFVSSAAILLLSGCLAAAQSTDASSPANPSFAPPPGEDGASNSQDFLAQTNQPLETDAKTTAENLKKDHDKLANAQNLVTTRQFNLAEPILLGLLVESVPEDLRKQALYELAMAVEGENDLPRAQSILAQYLEHWAGDVRTPEILLRQGQIFRQMGLNNLALGKFYAVMTVALSLKDDQLNYYQHLVLQAQLEIAETHYLMGQFNDAADFYARLLKSPDLALNRPLAQYRLVRSLAITDRTQEAIGAAQDFLARYPDDPQEPEVRYYLAQGLKVSGQNGEALRQVLLFLREEKSKTKDEPEVWAYWQQRVGNEIANELYKEGDYVKALDVYESLAKLDPSPAWQIPVKYQVGITYEHLMQPEKAVATYNEILTHEVDVGTNTTPGLTAVFDMSRWRVNFLTWQQKAENVAHAMAPAVSISDTRTNSTEVTTQ
jgi:tetratricopeptide (TPR) repeat protein